MIPGVCHILKESVPANNVIGRFRNESSVARTPLWVLLEHFFNDLIGISIFDKNLLQGLNDGKRGGSE